MKSKHDREPTDAAKRHVARRRVFYIPGYDPIHPRRYRELYRTESTEQSRISNYDIALKPKSGARYGWQVHGRMEGRETHAEVEVLLWSDIVRSSMSHSIMATYLNLVRTAWIYISTGTLWRLMRLRKGPVIAALYPVTMLLLQLAIAIGIGAGVAALCVLAIESVTAPHALRVPVFAVVSVILAALVLQWFRSQDARIFAYYLMHDFSHSARHKGAYSADLEARMASFRGVIRNALSEEVDEVLIVGHSSGAHLAVSILADLLRERPTESAPALALLTLGQVMPMVSFLPHADRLRRDLRDLSRSGAIFWVDVTAPGDGCSFALCDPVAVTGVAPPDQKWPLVISAAFTQTLSPHRWRALRWRFFRLHFQYLCAFDQVGDYDYFRITAGPMTLRQRFKNRAPSKSRITRSASKYRSMD